MRPIGARLDPVPPPARWIKVAAAVSASAALASVAGTWLMHGRLEATQAAAAEASRRAEKEQQASAAAEAASAQQLANDPGRQAWLLQRTSQWPVALTALENVSVPGVLPGAVEVVVAERSVKLDLRFSDHDSLLDYVAALNAWPDLHDTAWRWSVKQTEIGTSRNRSMEGRAVVIGEWR